MSDAELIATWQMFRKAMGAVDGQLSAALIEGDHQPSIFYEALAALAAAPEQMMPMGDLATIIGISTGGLTKLVDRMVQTGMVRRHHSTTDRRVVLAVLTDKGSKHERRSTVAYAEQLRRDFDNLGPHGLGSIRAICRQIETNFAETTDQMANSVRELPRRKGATHG